MPLVTHVSKAKAQIGDAARLSTYPRSLYLPPLLSLSFIVTFTVAPVTVESVLGNGGKGGIGASGMRRQHQASKLFAATVVRRPC